MLGNFSFGDYFKRDAIVWAWELLTEVTGPRRRPAVGDGVHRRRRGRRHLGRRRRMYRATAYSGRGKTISGRWATPAPAGRARRSISTGAPNGGWAAARWGAARSVTSNCGTSFSRLMTARLPVSWCRCPSPGIDTGAGFERMLTILQGARSVWETDVLRPLVARAEALTGRTYGDDAEVDVALRVLADHARTMSFMISDGVFPSNEDRGYVLRRIIRRAVLRASLLGTSRPVCPSMVEAVVEVMGDAYPDLAKNADFVSGVAGREEERFRSNLRSGMTLLEAELAAGGVISGETAFKLHDTHGFPIELTREIAAGRGAAVDDAGFARAMERQREQSREAGRGKPGRRPGQPGELQGDGRAVRADEVHRLSHA